MVRATMMVSIAIPILLGSLSAFAQGGQWYEPRCARSLHMRYHSIFSQTAIQLQRVPRPHLAAQNMDFAAQEQ